MKTLIALFVVGMTIVPSSMPAGAEPLESLTVSYDASTCRPIQGGHANLHASIDAEVRGLSTGATYEQTIPMGPSPGAAVATFKVVPDAYYIEGSQQKTNCSPGAGIVEIVLPGHSVSTQVPLANCCADAVAESYVAGLVAPALGMRIMSLPTLLPCGAPVAERALHQLPGAKALTRVGNAYYGAVSELGEGTLLLEVWNAARRAFFNLALAGSGIIGAASTYKRLDITDDIFQRASLNGNALFCEPALGS